jgi:Leu/Phe-tRNA-protein transferase
MEAGFLLMSLWLGPPDGGFILLPELHLERSVLFFPLLHVKRSVKPLLSRYELRFNTDFTRIVDTCVGIHGDDWLTAPLVMLLKRMRRRRGARARPVSFGLYRDGKLKAGEFGILCGRVYTSYSGYYSEDNAGTVQMILMAKYLEQAGFDFLDLGMPLDYKNDLGAQNIGPRCFVELFRTAQT